MGYPVLTIVLSSIICVAITFLLLLNTFCKKLFEKKVLASVFAVAVSLTLSTILNVSFFWYPYDFISNTTPLQYILPLLCLPLLFGSFFIKFPGVFPLSLLIACTISVLGSDLTIVFFSGNPFFINELLTILVFWLFAIGFRSTAGINTLPQIEGMTVCIGFILLYFLGQTPSVLASTATGLLCALFVSYFSNQKIPLGRDSAPILGYILGWIGLISYQEFLWPCFIIFSMLYLIEFGVALVYKATFLPQYKDLAYNTFLVRSLKAKIPVNNLVKLIMSSNAILVVLGLFQIVSNNETSLPLFAALLVSWELYRAMNWHQENKTLKEVNKEIVSQIKDSFNNLFSSQKKNDDTDKNK